MSIDEVRFRQILDQELDSREDWFRKIVDEEFDSREDWFRKIVNEELDTQFEIRLAGLFGQITGYFDEHFGKELRLLHEKFDQMQNTLDGFVGHMDRDDVERAAMSHQVNRHEEWINELADNTGTTLSSP